MKLAAFSVVACAIVVIVGCSPFGSSAADLQPVDSPNGTMTLKLSVNQSKADTTKYLCVVFDVHDSAGKRLHHVQSNASDIQKWAIGWFDDSTIVLYSSDIGTCAWRFAEDGTLAQLPTPLAAELKEYGGQIKAAKYKR